MSPAGPHRVRQGVPFRLRRAMRPGDVPKQVRRMPGASSPATGTARSSRMGSCTSNAPCQTTDLRAGVPVRSSSLTPKADAMGLPRWPGKGVL